MTRSPTDPPVALALDVGGSSLKSGLVTPTGELFARRERPFDSLASADVLHDTFASEFRDLRQRAEGMKVLGLGVAMPGPFDYERGISSIRGQEKFEALYGVELPPVWCERAPFLETTPLYFVNDADAFALGELAYGAARGYARVLVVTLGTGCGSAFAVGGRIVTEGPGVPKDGDIYALPYDGARLDDALSSRGVLALWQAGGGRPAVTTVLELSQLAFEGNVAARETWAALGVRLAEALRPTLQVFKPEVLVLGGKISGSFGLFAEAAQVGLKGLEPSPDVRPARDIDGAALRGAASVVFERVGV